MNINKIRFQLKVIKYLVSDNIDGLSDIELTIVYNDISKINDILLDKLMKIQNEYERKTFARDCVTD